MAISVLDNARREHIRLDPYPHLVIENALPQEYFERLLACYPDVATVAGGGELENNKLYIRSAEDVIGDPTFDPLWDAFFRHHCSADYYGQVLELWGEVLDKVYPDIVADFGKPLKDFTVGTRHVGGKHNADNQDRDIQMDCQFSVNSEVREVSSVRGPHVDSRYKLFNTLLYFRLPEDDSAGGEFELYRYKAGRYHYDSPRPFDFREVNRLGLRKLEKIPFDVVEKVKSVPYRSNTLVMLLNTPYSIHGVSDRSVTALPRRYVNFLVESYVGRNGGFFAMRPPRWRAAARRLLGRNPAVAA